MILPIVLYGSPVLRKKATEIDNSYPNLTPLIADMFETMYKADGVGLAAPQIGLDIRLFVIDGAPMLARAENEADLATFRKVFINPKILNQSGDEWGFEEGCLSIPGIREMVYRKPNIEIEYFDEQFIKHQTTLSGIKARIFQHEFDHLEGVLFTDYASSLKKQMLKTRLTRIAKGEIESDYLTQVYNSKA